MSEPNLQSVVKFKHIFKSAIVSIMLLYAPLLLAEQSLTPLLEPRLDAPDFNLQDMDDAGHKMSAYRGKPVIINFWATWCPPCREEMPSMERAWQKIKDQGIAMLAINVGEDEDQIFTFLGDYPASFTILRDESGGVTEQWPVRGLPTTFIVSPDGKLVYRAIGGREWDDEQILDKIRELKTTKVK